MSAEPPKPKSGSEVVNRVIFSILMAYGAFAFISLGAKFLLPFIQTVMIMMFREILQIHQKERKNRHMHYFRILPWYFLVVTCITTTGFVLKRQFIATIPAIEPMYQYFGFATFLLYIFGFVGFVMSLQKGLYRYQMSQFTWMAMTLIFIVGQGSMWLSNISFGVFWFVVPVSAVVKNDIYAYLCGKFFGRTQLIKLSPKKTLEGFLGAAIFTVLFSVWFAGMCCSWEQFVCPTEHMLEVPRCKISPLYIRQPYDLPPVFANVGLSQMNLAPVQFHAIFIALFASLIAPFGGLFASGLKRAFRLKDFGDLIPGHGGMTDRMDCQIIMGFFTYCYIQFVVIGATPTACGTGVEGLVECFQQLSPAEKIDFAGRVGL